MKQVRFRSKKTMKENLRCHKKFLSVKRKDVLMVYLTELLQSVSLN